MAVWQALLIAVWAGYCSFDDQGPQMLRRPLLVGPLVGIILGDVKTGLVISATLELMWMGLGNMALSVLGNYMVEALGLTEMSVSYKEAESYLYSPPFPVQVLASGLVIPFAEEVIFRGLGFASLREKLPFWLSAVLSAALFGLYHGCDPH